MNSAVINIKTNPQIKKSAQKIADELGFSLSSLINAYLRQLIKTKTVTFSALDEEPTDYLLTSLKESQEDIKSGRISPSFDNAKDAITWLRNPHETYEGKV